jgi:gliding motility-associated-like protein
MKKYFSLLFFALTLTVNAGGENESTYRVVATQNGNSQITSTSNEVGVLLSALIYVPNAFTPDGDGLNDTWGAVGQGFSEFKMQVFNRWGELIFESANINEFWDGTHNNEKAQDGVYVYKISGKAADMQTYYSKTGSVTLIR